GVVRGRLQVHSSAVCITDRTFVAFLLGLTGNIACGKSTVGQLLAECYGAEYVDADRLVHVLYAADTPETAAIVARFGADLLMADGTIDRRRLGDRVLNDRPALRDLEKILHPGVRRAIEARIAATPAPVLVIDAIRLIEAGLADRCDAVWVVTCSPDLQLARLRASRGLTSEQAQLRIAAQPPQEEKVSRATSVLQNTGSLDELERQVEVAWRRDIAPQLAQSSPP
ncbi:MAG TPA: dephospho-CoA kinase, partial [Chloroflexota bacterium]|nr:dephospho-CoA kinase [Chloroflexota bacterium]